MEHKSENAKVLTDFVAFCQRNPEQRFWQALRNWSEMSFVLAVDNAPFGSESNVSIIENDTFYWKGKGRT